MTGGGSDVYDLELRGVVDSFVRGDSSVPKVGSVMVDPVIREAKLFEVGSYPDKGLTVTESDLDVMVAKFTDAVPVRVQHGDSPWDGMMGFVVSVRRVGKELLGQIAWPVHVWEFLCKMGTKKLSVGLNKAKELVEVSVVDKPRVLTAQAFGDSMPALLFSGDFESESGGKGMPGEYSAEVQAAINAARDLGKTEGAAEAGTRFSAQLGPLAQENADLKRKNAVDSASVKLSVWTAEGKLPPACLKFVEAILVDGAGVEVTFNDGTGGHMPAAEAMVQFMTNMPRVVDVKGVKDEGGDNVEFSESDAKAAEAMGMTKEEYLAGQKEGN